MTYTGTLRNSTPLVCDRISRKLLAQIVAGAVAVVYSGLVGTWMLYARPGFPGGTAPSPDSAAIAAAPAAAVAAPAVVATAPAAVVTIPNDIVAAPSAAIPENTYVALLDSTYSLGSAPVSLGQSAPLGSSFLSSAPAPLPKIAETEKVLPMPVPPDPQLVESVPLPAPRPAELRLPAIAEPRLPPGHGPLRAPRQIAQNRTSVPQTAPPDDRSFFEKLFGIQRRSAPALAYASAEPEIGRGRSLLSRSLPYDRATAVYDISAHTVYLPDGTRLEAHSGLGSRLDDPRHVNERNLGATPPHVYELEPREELFHGVQALRLNPVGGGDIFGRTGLLAHTYMLGPNGDSNGCVSFRNYDAFLRAYKNGEIKRLAVVARMD